MTAETARLALEALYRLVGEAHGAEIELIVRGKNDND